MFKIDISECEKCKGLVRIIACIEDLVVIEKILAHLKAKEGEQEFNSDWLPPPRAPPLLLGMDKGLVTDQKFIKDDADTGDRRMALVARQQNTRGKAGFSWKPSTFQPGKERFSVE